MKQRSASSSVARVRNRSAAASKKLEPGRQGILDQVTRLHENLYNKTRFSVGQPLLEKIYDNSRQDHDALIEASCDATVGLDVDVVSMLKGQAYPFYGARHGILEVGFSCALVWLKVYQLERRLMIATASGKLDLANGQPTTGDWKTGLKQFRPDGPVRRLVEQGRLHMVHFPMARVQEVDRIHTEYRSQLNRLYRAPWPKESSQGVDGQCCAAFTLYPFCR